MNYCINCGNKIDGQVDLEMREGMKLCRSCYDYSAKKYADFLFECVSCNRIIRTLSFIENMEFVMCRDCAITQSTLQENMVKVENKRSQQNVKVNEPTKMN